MQSILTTYLSYSTSHCRASEELSACSPIRSKVKSEQMNVTLQSLIGRLYCWVGPRRLMVWCLEENISKHFKILYCTAVVTGEVVDVSLGKHE